MGSWLYKSRNRGDSKSIFEKSIATDSVVNAPIKDKQSDLNALYKQIGIISEAIKQLNMDKNIHPELKLGIYCSITPYTKVPIVWLVWRCRKPKSV